MSQLNVIFFGTPDFSVPALEMLVNHPAINVCAVITMPDRPAGRGHALHSPPVAEFAKLHKIKLFQTENINKCEEFFEFSQTTKIDFAIVLAFAQFLGSKILNLPKLGCFNIHTSLLPKYRGAAPIQFALLNGDTQTGVSIQKMVKKMDAGDIVKETTVEISNTETGGQLYTRLKFQAALTLNNFIYDILNEAILSYPQNEANVSFAPTLQKENGHLHFETLTANDIYNRVRALKPWPGTYCFINKKRFKIIDVEIVHDFHGKAGVASTKNKQLIIGTMNGGIHIKNLQAEGKKACSDLDFLNGLHSDEQLTFS